MSRREINRAFSDAQFRPQATASVHFKKPNPPKKRKYTESAEEHDVVNKIITAFEQKNFLKVLDLPAPRVCNREGPDWSLSESQIMKNYRRLSLLVHPDKNTDRRAQQAFDLLNKVQQMLLDDSKREEIVKGAWELALAEEEKREARATVDEKIKLNSEKIKQKQKLTKMQRDSFNSEIVRQMKERQMHNSLKKRKIADSKYAMRESEQPLDDGGTDKTREKEEKVVESSGSKPNARQSNRERIKNRLKVMKVPKEEEENPEEEAEEWKGPALHKTKPQRRKPRFMF